MHNDMSSGRLSLDDAAARVAFGTQQFIEIAAAEPNWGRLLMWAFSEFEAIKDMARLAREENEALKARIAALEGRVGTLAGEPPSISRSSP